MAQAVPGDLDQVRVVAEVAAQRVGIGVGRVAVLARVVGEQPDRLSRGETLELHLVLDPDLEPGGDKHGDPVGYRPQHRVERGRVPDVIEHAQTHLGLAIWPPMASRRASPRGRHRGVAAERGGQHRARPSRTTSPSALPVRSHR